MRPEETPEQESLIDCPPYDKSNTNYINWERTDRQDKNSIQATECRPPENTNREGNQADTTRENKHLMRVVVIHCPHLAHIQRKDGRNTTSGNRKMGDDKNGERSIRLFDKWRWHTTITHAASDGQPCFVGHNQLPIHACNQTFSDFSTTQASPWSSLCPCPRCRLHRTP